METQKRARVLLRERDDKFIGKETQCRSSAGKLIINATYINISKDFWEFMRIQQLLNRLS